MKRIVSSVSLSIVLASIAGCERSVAEGPPSIRLGDSVCAQCNMIISDERWATATMVEGPRGSEARLFDDFNCQVNFEVENPDATILARWSHSHTTGAWVPTEDAFFLVSQNLRTPMGSSVAAFASVDEVNRAKAEFSGDVTAFDVAWKRLGFAGACCHAEENSEDQPTQAQNDASEKP
jgi:copper chaperone NosL